MCVAGTHVLHSTFYQILCCDWLVGCHYAIRSSCSPTFPRFLSSLACFHIVHFCHFHPGNIKDSRKYNSLTVVFSRPCIACLSAVKRLPACPLVCLPRFACFISEKRSEDEKGNRCSFSPGMPSIHPYFCHPSYSKVGTEDGKKILS